MNKKTEDESNSEEERKTFADAFRQKFMSLSINRLINMEDDLRLREDNAFFAMFSEFKRRVKNGGIEEIQSANKEAKISYLWVIKQAEASLSLESSIKREKLLSELLLSLGEGEKFTQDISSQGINSAKLSLAGTTSVTQAKFEPIQTLPTEIIESLRNINEQSRKNKNM